MTQILNDYYIKQTCFYFDNSEGLPVLAAPIPEFHGYWAAVDGSIFSLKSGKPRLLKAAKNGNGYKFVILSVKGRSKKNYVSRLVAATFLVQTDALDRYGNQRNEVNHLDGNRANNRLPNLEWCSSAENHEHAKKVLRSEEFLTSKFAADYLRSKAA